MVVLRVDSSTLYDRLSARYILYSSPLSTFVFEETSTNTYVRKYPEAKLQENLDSEIMEVLLQEARDSYDEQIVVELTSNTTDEMESNVDRIEAWVKQWKQDHAADGDGDSG